MTIADGMILIAATAAGIALAKSMMEIHWRQSWTFYVRWALPILACWTAATLTIRLRPPRPPIRRLMRQPGAASGVVVLLALAIVAGAVELNILRGGYNEYSGMYLAAIPAGTAVLGTWIISWLTRTYRTEAGAIDRLGRVLGFCWILELFVMTWIAFVH